MAKMADSGIGLLVKSYAEGIKKELLEKNQETFRRVVGRKSGVYTLTKGKKLYYVGLSTKLRSRLKSHLDDKHRGKWDRFSFYSIGRKKYLKDIESMLVRVARPQGNDQEGKFGKNKNLKKRFINELKRDILDTFAG